MGMIDFKTTKFELEPRNHLENGATAGGESRVGMSSGVSSGATRLKCRVGFFHKKRFGEGLSRTHEKFDLLTPCGNWGGFDKTEVCGKMVRSFMGPGSPFFCLTE